VISFGLLFSSILMRLGFMHGRKFSSLKTYLKGQRSIFVVNLVSYQTRMRYYRPLTRLSQDLAKYGLTFSLSSWLFPLFLLALCILFGQKALYKCQLYYIVTADSIQILTSHEGYSKNYCPRGDLETMVSRSLRGNSFYYFPNKRAVNNNCFIYQDYFEPGNSKNYCPAKIGPSSI
jgi:hypothetical protein